MVTCEMSLKFKVILFFETRYHLRLKSLNYFYN